MIAIEILGLGLAVGLMGCVMIIVLMATALVVKFTWEIIRQKNL